LTLPESVIQYDKELKSSVEVEIGAQQFEQRKVELGLSDGINVKILSGITLTDKIKKQHQETVTKGRS
jgi:HlyD family secretion protein